MQLVDKMTRICVGTFIMFIGWTVVAAAASLSPFTHSLPYMTRIFVALPISIAFGVPAALIFSYGALMALGVYPVPLRIISSTGGN